MKTETESSFEHAKYNDGTVEKMLKAGASLEEIIGQLAAEKEIYLKRIAELSLITPKKWVLPSGKTILWQCPDDLVPTEILTENNLNDPQ
jgi:hypothetical protein